MLKRALAAVESALDQIKHEYKWRFDRWKHLRLAPYRGYGTAEELFAHGRVLDDKDIPEPQPGQPLWKNAWYMWQRIESDEVPGARVQLRFQEETHKAETSEDGFFQMRFAPAAPLPGDQLWHEGTLDLLRPAPNDSGATRKTAALLVPPASAEFAVVSDVDDTVIYTNAANKLHMTAVLMFNNAETRTPFPGVGAFYQALQRGSDGAPCNPIFYLSSSPWNYYGLFQRFFEAHGLPAGPLFLKDYGLSENKFIKTGHRGHKIEYIRDLMDTYPDLGFVLIGDSGQEDPEIYHEIAQERPGRVRAIFVRDVTAPERDAEVDALAREVEAAGVPMHRVESSTEAAERAAELGLIREGDVEAVRQDQAEREEAMQRHAPSTLEQVVANASKTALLAALGGGLALAVAAYAARRRRQ